MEHSNSGEDVEIVEEVIVVDVVNNEIPQDQYDNIVVIATETSFAKAPERSLENKLRKFTLQDHDYTAHSSKVSHETIILITVFSLYANDFNHNPMCSVCN